MHGGGLLGGCLPPVRSMYDAKKTDEWQADSRGPEPLNRMKARASTVAGDGGASNVMVAPGVEYIAKQKVPARRTPSLCEGTRLCWGWR